MRVFIISRVPDYQNCEILAVCLTREKADDWTKTYAESTNEELEKFRIEHPDINLLKIAYEFDGETWIGSLNHLEIEEFEVT